MRLYCLFTLIFLVAADFAFAEPVRLAILTGEGERAVADATLAQLEVALTENKEVTLLERAQIRKILAEQKLSAAGLTDPSTAVKMGKLLSVEMFLFLDRVPRSQPPICRVQLIETKTGIALAAGTMEETELGGGGAEMAGMIQRAMAKRAMPVAERHYVGLLGVRSEDPGDALDGMARTLWTLLSCDLEECPGLVLLDREHVQRLSEEKQLTDAEQALKLSMVLIDGGLRRSAEKNKMELTLLLRPLAGGAPENLPAFRKELIAALAERLKAKLPERQGGNPEKEAQTFMSQARLLTLCGDREASLRANETAYAIWPDRTTRLALVEAYSKRKYMWETFNKVPEQDQVKALQYEVRMLTLLREQWRTELAPGAPEAQDSGPQGASLGTPINAGFGVLIREAPPEISALQKEAVALQRNIFDMAMDAAQRDPKKYGYAYWEALGSAVWRVNSIHFLHPQEQAAGWREFFIALRKRPASDEVGPRWTIQSLREEMNSLRGLSEPDKADVRRLFIPVFKEFTSDPDLTVRLAAHVGLINVDPSAADSAEIFLQYTAEGVDWKISSDYSAPPDLSPAQRAAALLCDQRPELAGAYCEKIMGAWIKQGVLNRDEKCTGLVGTLVRGTEKAKGKAEACALCGRVLAALHECKDRQPNAPRWVDQYIHTFEELRAQMTAAADAPKPAPAPEVAGAPDPDDPWKQYEVRCLGLTLKAPVCGAIVRGDRLYCISCADISFGSAGPYQEDGTRKVTVSAHRFPDGGPALRADTLAVPLGKSIIRSQAVWAGFAGDSLYISTGGSLVSFPANAVPRVLTDADGWTVTGMPIAAMAAFGGKLYLTVGERVSGDWVKPKHAFVVFDPAARAVRVIFSNTALEEAQRRDVMIVTVLADEARKCLWVTLAGGKDSSGLFHYDPATDKLDKLEAANQSDTPADIAAPYAGPPVQTVTLCPMGLLVLTMHQGRKPPIVNMLAVLDPQTRKETWLAGQVFGPYLKRRDGDPLFASSSIALWPAWYDGMTLITAGMNAGSGMENKGGGRLFLHRMEREPACYQALVVTPVFEPTPQGLLVFDTAGEGYLIRKK